jgi:hypothetical protein
MKNAPSSEMEEARDVRLPFIAVWNANMDQFNGITILKIK